MPISRLLASMCLIASGDLVSASAAIPPSEPDTTVSLRIHYEWKARLVSRGEFADVTTIHHVAEATCPLFASHVDGIPVLQEPNAQQMAASQAAADAATRQVEAISPNDVSSMQAVQRQMEDCQRTGGNDTSCAMLAMAAIQNNPELMASMGEMGRRGAGDAEAASDAMDAAAGRFQQWLNDDCSGTMTVNDSIQLDDPTVMGIEPPVLTHGRAAIESGQTLVQVETDLVRGETRYRIISPSAQGFTRDAGNGNAASTVSANALPIAVLDIGPKQGAIQSGEFTEAVQGGEINVRWTLLRD